MEPADEILDGTRKDVMDPGPSVGRGWTLIKDEGRPVPTRVHGLPKETLGFPGLQLTLFQLIQGEIRPGRKRHQGSRSTTPRMSRVSDGSARVAVAMIFPMSAGSSASGRH